MKKTVEEKLERKRHLWLERTGRALQLDDTAVLPLLRQEQRQSLRLNPLVARPEKTLAKLAMIGWQGRTYSWADHCYTIDEGRTAVRDSAVVASGAAFIQNAASWLPVLALDPRPNEYILDVCAAPGGKASHIAALTNNQAHLWVNDNSRVRLAKMRANFQRLGVTAESMTLFDATLLVRKLEGRQFDKILLDAPCSGEGLMRYGNDKDFATWSVAHIKRLQQLQKRLITQAWQLVKPGGTLIYSTCTMAPEENEAVVDYLLRKADDARIEPFDVDVPNKVAAIPAWSGRHFDPSIASCMRLAPDPTMEAFFVCKLKKLAESPADRYTQQQYEQ